MKWHLKTGPSFILMNKTLIQCCWGHCITLRWLNFGLDVLGPSCDILQRSHGSLASLADSQMSTRPLESNNYSICGPCGDKQAIEIQVKAQQQVESDALELQKAVQGAHYRASNPPPACNRQKGNLHVAVVGLHLFQMLEPSPSHEFSLCPRDDHQLWSSLLPNEWVYIINI